LRAVLDMEQTRQQEIQRRKRSRSVNATAARTDSRSQQQSKPASLHVGK